MGILKYKDKKIESRSTIYSIFAIADYDSEYIVYGGKIGIIQMAKKSDLGIEMSD